LFLTSLGISAGRLSFTFLFCAGKNRRQQRFSLCRLYFARICCSSFFFFFFTVCFVCCILQIYTHPIIDLIRRERENMHARQGKEGERLEILFSLSTFFCIRMCVCRKKAERISILLYAYIHLKSV
jgi:hypothetical protein